MRTIRSARLTVALATILVGAVGFVAWQGFGGAPAGFAKGGPGGPPGGGGDEGFGNNLSVPATFAEGIGVLGLPTSEDTGLRPRPEEANPTLPYFDASTAYVKDGTTYYPQQSASTWQAGWRDGVGLGDGVADESVVVNWSDNLTKQTWTATAKVRVETVLYQVPTDTLLAYAMRSLYGAQSSEIQGTDGTEYASSYRTVFSPNARLIIQKLDGRGGNPVGAPCFEGAVYEDFSVDGPGGYSAEVNVSGNLIYGYNWNVKGCPGAAASKLGWWRLTFQLDESAIYTLVGEEGEPPRTFEVRRNTAIGAIDPADLLPEVRYRPEPITNEAMSVLEIEIKTTKGGGKPK